MAPFHHFISFVTLVLPIPKNKTLEYSIALYTPEHRNVR